MQERMKVVIAEADPLERDLMVLALQQKGYLVETASQEEAIYTLVKAVQPDLVILDTFLPGVNGIDVMINIRKLKLVPSDKFIIVSGMRFQEVVTRAIQAGASDFIAKPIDLDLFLERISRITQG